MGVEKASYRVQLVNVDFVGEEQCILLELVVHRVVATVKGNLAYNPSAIAD